MYAKSLVGAAAVVAACAFGAGTASAVAVQANITASGNTVTTKITGAVSPVDKCAMFDSVSGNNDAGNPDVSGNLTLTLTSLANGQHDIIVKCIAGGVATTVATKTVTLPASSGTGSLSFGSLG